MSEKVLSGACNDCPMRRKIDCDKAEVVMTTTHKIPRTSTFGKVLYMEVKPNDPVGNYSFQLSDTVADPNAQRFEIQTLRTEEFTETADAAAIVAREYIEKQYKDSRQRRNKGLRKIEISIRDSLQEIGTQMYVQKAEQASLKESLAASVTNCEGPQKEEDAFFLRRKKCGAGVLGRVISRANMTKRNEEAALLKRYGSLWTTPEHLGKFKPIR